MKSFLLALAAIASLCVSAHAQHAKTPDRKPDTDRPNIVIVLCDDLGYGDLGCYGNKDVKTPHIDAFAKGGMRFTDYYAAAPNCSPSRAGLMTGRTPTRIGIHNWIPFLSPMHLRQQEVTLATLLRMAGYVTSHVGKWHLNGWFNLPGQPQPNDHGFDHWFSTQNNALPNHRNTYNFVRNGIPMGKLEGYSSHVVVDEAVRWLKQVRDRKKPFFQFICFHEPHEPIATAKKYTDMYPYKDNPSKSAHHGNITQMDEAFGRYLATLEKLGLRENTFIIFTSDNGPAITSIHPHGSAGPLRAKKGHMYDGGIRVPAIVQWPGHTKPGQESSVPVGGVDILPTVCAITGVKAPMDRALDGTSITAVFAGKQVQRKTPLYWHFNAASSAPRVAMRMGDWMLLAELDQPAIKSRAGIDPEDQKWIKTARLTKMELYNLREDIGQEKDLATVEIMRLQEMASILRKKYREVQEASPTWPAWEFPRYEGQRIEWPEYYLRKKKGK